MIHMLGDRVKQNLDRLSCYLLSDNLQAQFNMHAYGMDRSQTGVGQETCGTVGCAVGHGPFVSPDMAKLIDESWNEYCVRIFGVSSSQPEWEWMFGANWEDIDNTPQGAAKRIRYLLSGNGVPATFEEDLENFDDDDEKDAHTMEKYIKMYQ